MKIKKNTHLKLLKKTLNITIITIIIIFNINCSTLKNISKYHDINQGNYLNTYDIQKIHIGMTKNEISHNLGLPTLQDLFGLNIWYYIHYHQYQNGIIKQTTLILKFNEHDILINLKNKST